MVWQTDGVDAIHEGYYSGKTINLHLLVAGTDYTEKTYTDAASLVAVELAASSGYSAGGAALGGLVFRKPANTTTSGLDWTDEVFTDVRVAAGTVMVTGIAVRDATNDIVLFTAPFAEAVAINQTSLNLTVKAPDATGVAGVYGR